MTGPISADSPVSGIVVPVQAKAPFVRPLKEILAYQNDMVVHSFCERYPMPFEEARGIFDDMKRWLWLAATCVGTDQRAIIYDELRIIDEMWHTFVLYTKAYWAFCNHFFGTFIHHDPTTKDERDAHEHLFSKDAERVLEDGRALRRRQYELILEKLGEDVLERWHIQYPERFGDEYFPSKP